MKKLTLFLFTIFVTTFSVNAQSQSDVLKPKRLKIGLVSSTDFCHRFNTSDENNISGQDNLLTKEKFKIGYTNGLMFGFETKKRISFDFGILHSNKGLKTIITKPEDKFILCDFNDCFISIKSRHDFHYIDIPFKVNTYIGQKKVRLFLSAGVAANILVKEVTNVVKIKENSTEKDKFESKIDVSQINLSSQVGVGVDYAMNENTDFRLEPTFRFNVASLTQNSFNYNLYSIGAAFTAYKRF